MRVAINGSMLDEQPTGVGVYTFNLINHLAGRRFGSKKEITVFSPTHFNLNNDIKIIKLPRFLQSSKYGKLAAFFRVLWNLMYYPAQAKKFDLLLNPTSHANFLSDNQIITVHDLISLHYKNISSHQRFYFRNILPFLLKKAKLIIAVSENTKKDIIHFYNCPSEKIKVIYNGFDHLCYVPEENNDEVIYKKYGVKNYFLAVGPTYPHKNFEMLIRSYAELDIKIKKQHPLVIAGGKRKYLQSIRLLVEEIKLQEHVHFLGYVPIENMPSLYRKAFALVFPSLHEGFGIPLLEAMGCGCPVLASNTTSIPEVCGDAAIYFNPMDMSSLVSSLQSFVNNNELRTVFVEKGKQRARNFSWEKMAFDFEKLMDEFLNNQILEDVRN